jgi:hypothetical protein
LGVRVSPGAPTPLYVSESAHYRLWLISERDGGVAAEGAEVSGLIWMDTRPARTNSNAPAAALAGSSCVRFSDDRGIKRGIHLRRRAAPDEDARTPRLRCAVRGPRPMARCLAAHDRAHVGERIGSARIGPVVSFVASGDCGDALREQGAAYGRKCLSCRRKRRLGSSLRRGRRSLLQACACRRQCGSCYLFKRSETSSYVRRSKFGPRQPAEPLVN